MCIVSQIPLRNWVGLQIMSGRKIASPWRNAVCLTQELDFTCQTLDNNNDYPHHSEETSKRVSSRQKLYKSLQIQQIGLPLECPSDRNHINRYKSNK